ncbi:hypothetical protein BH11MYX1_BH11MYX1_31880 [soil metagenome]
MRVALVLVLGACSSSSQRVARPERAMAPLSLAADRQMVLVPEGAFVSGSTPEERAQAYDDFAATSKTETARDKKWFEGEDERHMEQMRTYRLDLLPVTMSEYAELVQLGGAPAPMIDEATWTAQGFAQPYATVARFVWKDGQPPKDKLDHPVVLVTYDEAEHYCAWRGTLAGEPRRLPSGLEYEKAARGPDGFAYPWGNDFDPTKLDSAVGGPGDTVPVGQYATGASPFGVLELAGNVFEWTSAPFSGGKRTVKGSAWEDFAGVGRGASRHGRKPTVRHVIVGFRCAGPAGAAS